MKTINLPDRDSNINHFCPFCGVLNSGLEGTNACKHLLFVYLNIGEGIEFIREDISNLIDDKDDSEVAKHLTELEIEGGFIFEVNTPAPSMAHFMIGYQCED